MKLTDRQRDAVRSLEWIHSTRDGDRATGRSTALAVVALRRALIEERIVYLEDEHMGPLIDAVRRLIHEYGLPVEVLPRRHDGVGIVTTRGSLSYSQGAEEFLRDTYVERPGSTRLEVVAKAEKKEPPLSVWDLLLKQDA